MRKFKFIILFALAGVLITSYQNCSGLLGEASHDGLNISLTEDGGVYQAIRADARAVLETNCAGCHNPTNMPTGPIPDILNQKAMLDAGAIVLGSPQTSPLYLSVIDGMMPQGSAPLSDTDVNVLREWILGAKADDDLDFGGGGGGGTTLTPPTFANVNRLIIQPACVRCHGGNGSLENYTEVMKYVVARNLAGSSLYTRVASNNMPQGGPALNGDLKSLLQRWIQAGAPNN